MDKVLFSHKSDDWSTPTAIYNSFMGLGYYDPCPLHADFDGLSKWWGKKAFVNPPYSKMKAFVKKAISEACNGCDVWLLVPARVGTLWFHRFTEVACDIYFIVGRLKFGGVSGNAPFDCALVHLFAGYTPIPFVRCEWVKREDLEELVLSKIPALSNAL